MHHSLCRSPLVVLLLLLLACGGKGGSGSDTVDAAVDAELDLSDAQDGGDSDRDAEPDAVDVLEDADSSLDADADAPDDDTSSDADEDGADADADPGDVDTGTSDADASDAELDADIVDVSDAADATDAGSDVPVEVPESMIKLVDPSATPAAWYDEGAFGWAADLEGDWFAVSAPEDNQRGAKAGALLVGRRVGERWVTERVAPSELAAGDRFGSSVSISGDRMLVGAAAADDGSGEAHILEVVDGRWSITASFTARTPQPLAAFGSAVALDGTIAAVASWSPDLSNGTVELYSDTGDDWERFLVLESPTGADESSFGQAVAMSEGVLAVGDPSEPAVYLYRAPYDAPPERVSDGTVADSYGTALAMDSGRLAVGAFGGLIEETGERGGALWLYSIQDEARFEETLQVASLEDGARFGYASALDGDQLVVGAYRAAASVERSGAAYRYVLGATGWTLEETLLPESLVAGDRFGIAVAVGGGSILSTAIRDDTIAEDAGAVYLYERGGESAEPPRRFFVGNAADNAAFGTSVATDGEVIAIGAPFDDADGADTGSVHLFERAGAGIRYAGRLPHAFPMDDQHFGASVAISGDWIVVGAPGDDELGPNVGAVYAFERDGDDWAPRGRIRSPGPADDGDFGATVAISGTTVIIGAPARVDVVGSGGTWLYRRGEGDVWVYVSRLDAAELELRPGVGEDAEMGHAVLASGNLFMAGAPAEDRGAGAAYMWAYTPGAPPSTLLPVRLSELPEGARFGSALASNGGDIIVGAAGQGRAYPLLPGSATSFPGTPVESPESGDRFGASLGFAGPALLAVGAPDAAVDGVASAGRVWVYDAAFDGWSSTPRSYAAPDASPGIRLGEALSAGGGIVVAGAAGDDERGSEAGAAWVLMTP